MDLLNRSVIALTQLSEEQLAGLSLKMKQEIRRGVKVKCETCPRFHTGRVPKCSECSKRYCQKCKKPFSRSGSGNTCGACMRKRSE